MQSFQGYIGYLGSSSSRQVSLVLSCHNFLLFPLIGFCQHSNPTPVDSVKTTNMFVLGEVVITDHTNKDTLNRVTSKTMESQNKMEVSKALKKDVKASFINHYFYLNYL
jgi:hypothetical protein